MSEGFFDRWSRRKQQAREEVAPAEPAFVPLPPQEIGGGGGTLTALAEAQSAHPGLPPEGQGVTAPGAEGAPPLSLADAEALTIDSDFRPFVAKGVQPEVKNAAFRKLFADPHFNVMDGMDTYIDDYSKPSPLPDSVLRQMASAKFLRLFEEAPDAVPAETPGSDGVPDVAQSDAPGNPPSPLVADAQPASQMTDDPNADLRLQPDDAARAPGARPHAG